MLHCDRPCGYMFNSVCDNLGNEHTSPCAFEIEQCKNPKLVIAFHGPCQTLAIISTSTPSKVELFEQNI